MPKSATFRENCKKNFGIGDSKFCTGHYCLKGVSDGGYHYLGAAKIMAPIGKAFAEEMAKLQAEEI